MATYTDTFNRADGALGSNWGESSWSDATSTIVSNALKGSGSGNSYHYWNGSGTWGREQYSEVTHFDAADSDRGGPCVYMTDANGCYYARGRQSNGFVEIKKVPNTGGDGTTLTTATVGGGTIGTGDTLRLKAEDNGSGNTLLTLYFNGSSVQTYTDTTSPLTSGKPGLCVEEFWRTEIDEWTGEDFTAAGAQTVTTTVTDQSGTALGSESGIAWTWSDTFTGNPTDTGTGEVTDASGELIVDLTGTSLTSGQFGYITVKLSNGNVGIAKESID